MPTFGRSEKLESSAFTAGAPPPLASQEMVGNAEVASIPSEAMAITGELFPGPIGIERDADPEAPNPPFVVVTVHASGTLKDIVRRRREWHDRVEPLLGKLDVRLSIVAQ